MPAYDTTLFKPPAPLAKVTLRNSFLIHSLEAA